MFVFFSLQGPPVTEDAPGSTKPRGHISLVGAGPGDPGHFTLRGVECLRTADVVLYDYLVNPRLLQHAPATAELICLGHHGHSRLWSQEEINTAIVAHARAGKRVVRLKSGDPAVFGRMAEEMEAILGAGVSYEIVPGITAALAAGSCAGVPLTHRDHASAVALITGHEGESKSESALDFAALAKFPGTLVFYMGVTTAPVWSAALMAAGKSPNTPVAIVRRCSFPDQTTTHCTLETLVPTLTTPTKMRPPIIVIVGDVTQFASAWNWFERRPLFGQRVLVTRPEHQAESLARPLQELGAEVLVQPAIEIRRPENRELIHATISRLSEFDWIVFSSVNGVRYFLDDLRDFDLDLRALGRAKLAAIGPGTAEELQRYHLRPDFVPRDKFAAESLAQGLASEAKGRRFLLIRASRGREVLAEELIAAGGVVEQVVAYESVDVPSPAPTIVEQLAAGRIDWVTVTSSAIARSLARLFGDDLRRAKLVSISPITTATLRELGYEVAAEAREYTMPGVVATMMLNNE